MKKDPKWQNTSLGRERREFLNQRIREVAIAGRGGRGSEPKEPASVRAARAIVEKYESDRRKIVDESEVERRCLCEDARRTVLFTDDPKVAMTAVDALIRTARMRRWIA